MLYKELVSLYEKLDSTSKRLEKTHHISQFLKKVDEDIDEVMLLIQGKVFPAWDDQKIGISSRLAIKAINKATALSDERIELQWKKLGDLGDVAKELIAKKKQSSLFPRELTIKEVFDNLQGLAKIEGSGSVDKKLDIIADMLISSSPLEAKYIIRTAVDNLRLGIGSGSIRDALVWSVMDVEYIEETNDIDIDDRDYYNTVSEKVQFAYDLSNDWGIVARTLKKEGLKGLEDINLEVGRPINVMLFQKAEDIKDAFDTVGKPAAFEYKYDGFRLQIHVNDHISLYTRRLEDVTDQFPDVVEVIKKAVKKPSILDAEVIGYDPDSGDYLPFQKISQRIRRKYDIEEIAKKFPVEVNVFDIIYYDGENLITSPFRQRREMLEKAVQDVDKEIVVARQLVTDDIDKAQEFYEAAQEAGEEGVMAKSLDAPYKPGSRVGYGVKIKSIMEPLDLVIVAGEYGEGKRSGWISSYYLACMDDGEFKEIGKVSTGLKELQGEDTTFADMTKLLEPLIEESSGKYVKVKPEIVIEVGYEEIQRSPGYSSGFALRFPRFIRLRTDEKTVEDINTLEDVKRLYTKQR